MYTRLLTLPDRSFFLFGPRGTGKTTYEGGATLRAGSVDVLPVAAFLKRLYAGEIIG